MNIVLVLSMSIIGAIIGWITNIIAIKLIFRPYKAIKIPVINFELQGLIPKRRIDIAKSIGDVVEEELLDIKEIFETIIDEKEIRSIQKSIKIKILKILDEKMPSIIPSMFKSSIKTYVSDLVDKEGHKMIEEFIQEAMDKAIDKICISQLVEEKINSFDIAKIEEIIISLAKKELKHIEVLGGVLGFIIGLFQGIIVLLIK
ncbi:DUF445 domain-containing protein [Abyssisolibacter fermentans]|uniref:DUF445 domain-containing protein n=1 Tax=Abyssisolibacter fermentans TaxID=1766203 RepID=UPI0008343542|nr:DUF445 family protein [Abyssisolibacter fermentans]